MQLTIGILTIGSLDWESKNYGATCAQDPIRVAWRKSRLRDEDESRVTAPIRYGRLSESRGNTFTTVFSPEYNHRLGTAKSIRCKADVTSIHDLVNEAEELWGAEDYGKHKGMLSATWGCVTVVISNNFLDHVDRNERQDLLKRWATRVSDPKEKFYGKLGFSSQDRKAAGGSVIKSGRLQIPWPTLTSGEPLSLDLLLATATNPEIGQKRARYPTVEEIANAWNNNDNVFYFRCNQLAGIHTDDDSAIEKLLK